MRKTTEQQSENEKKIQLSVILESAKSDMHNAVEEIRKSYRLPYCVMDMVILSILADIRKISKIEIINDTNEILKKKDEELRQAKEAAKKVLKTEPEEQETEEQPEE